MIVTRIVTRKMTFEIPEDIALEIDAEVASGAYSDQNSLVLDSLQAHLSNDRYKGGDPEIERWLHDQVLPTLERMDREQTPGIPADQVLETLRQRRLARKSAA